MLLREHAGTEKRSVKLSVKSPPPLASTRNSCNSMSCEAPGRPAPHLGSAGWKCAGALHPAGVVVSQQSSGTPSYWARSGAILDELRG